MASSWLGEEKRALTVSPKGASCLSSYSNGGPVQRTSVSDLVAPTTKTPGRQGSPHPWWDAGTLCIRYHEAGVGSG